MPPRKKKAEAPKPVEIVKAPPKVEEKLVPNHYEFYSYGNNLIYYKSLDPRNVSLTSDDIKAMLSVIKKQNNVEQVMVHLVEVSDKGHNYYDPVQATEEQVTEKIQRIVDQIKTTQVVVE